MTTIARRLGALEKLTDAKAKDPTLMSLPELYAAIVEEVTDGDTDRLRECLRLLSDQELAASIEDLGKLLAGSGSEVPKA